MSTLARSLQQVEDEFGEVAQMPGLEDARNDVTAALAGFRQNLYWLGKALHKYRTFLKGERTWRAVLNRLALELGCCAKTIDRLVENCARAERLPQYVLDAMLESKIDPSVTKNRELVNTLVRIPEPQSKAEAAASITSARADIQTPPRFKGRSSACSPWLIRGIWASGC